MNDKKNFLAQLNELGFINSPVLQTFMLTPRYCKDNEGNHHIVGNIHVCIFGGSDTPENGLGCVTFCYNSKTKLKGCRIVNECSELFKKAFCPKSVDEAITEFHKWNEDSKNEIKTWKKVL
jgi:hypothetical protein